MGHALTNKYALFFKKKGMKKVFSLAQDIYKYGKFRELVSFAVWEMYHKLGLFPKKDYLIFNNREAIKLENERLAGSEFDDKVTQFFASRGLNAVRCDHNWKLLYTNNKGEIFGSLYPDDSDLYKSTDGGESVVFVKRFQESIKSIFISSQNTIFVCVKGSLYKSSDGGASFKKTLDLGSPISFFRFNNAMTETPKRTLVGAEYGNIYDKNGWKKLAYLYYSSDDGETWKKSDFLIQKGTNKHVHIVKYSPLLNKLMMADGDNYKKLWLSDSLDVSDPENPNWKPVNRFHIQMGGYTSVVESDGRIFFGSDYQGGTNFIVESTDGEKFTKKIVPDPYRRSPIDNMVLRKGKRGNEIWANLPFSTANTKCLLMYSADHGKSWHKVFEYNRSTHTVWLVSSSNEIAEALYFSVEDSKNNSRVVYKLVDC
ncbi:MAG: glycoside hydrolase [Thermoproteota archaeon]|nr:glycoside hydrolase [Thermoproteota archaeon]